MSAEVINKITITAEAVFDLTKTLCLSKLDRRKLKHEVEKYIDFLNSDGRLLWQNYFRCKYQDEDEGGMLMLFLYRGKKNSLMQHWDLKGVCLESDWSEDDEEDGKIRAWIETKIEDLPDEDDWAVKARINEILRETEKTVYDNVVEEVRNAFDNNRDKETAEKLAFLQSVYFEFRGRKRAKKKTRRN